MSLTEHIDDFRARVGSELRRRGEVRHRLEAVTGTGEVFEIDTHWHDRGEREAFCRSLPGVLQRRGVKRYLMAAEAWMGSGKDVRPSLDPDRIEVVQVIGVERDGARCYFQAEIKRGGERPALAEWELVDAKGWMTQLFDGADQDAQAAISDEQPAMSSVLDEDDVRTLIDADPDRGDLMMASMELGEEIKEMMGRLYRSGEEWAAFGGLVATIQPLLPRCRNGLRLFAQMLRDNPDKYPITPSVKPPINKAAAYAVMKQHWRHYHDPVAELLRGHGDEAVVFNAVMNIAVLAGMPLMGGPSLADYLEELAAQDEAAAEGAGAG